MSIHEKSRVDTETCYFYPPPPGIPDLNAHFDGTTPRERVARAANKGSACWFVVMQWLTPAIGEHHEAAFEDDYETQKLVAHRHALLREAQETLDDLTCVHSALKEAACLAAVDKKTVRALLQNALKMELKNPERCKRALEVFLEQRIIDDLSEFATHHYFSLCNQVEEFFLFVSLGQDGERIEKASEITSFIKQFYAQTAGIQLMKPWEALDLFERAWALRSLSMAACARLLGFEQSKWNPHKSVKHLMKELKTHGPMMVQGYLGRPYYKDEPFELSDKVGRRAIWGWHPNAAKKEKMEREFHPVLIVGARCDTDKGHVYFVDSLDRSSPEDPNPVYVMSYPKFRQAAATLEGIKVDQAGISREATNFGWHGPFKDYI